MGSPAGLEHWRYRLRRIRAPCRDRQTQEENNSRLLHIFNLFEIKGRGFQCFIDTEGKHQTTYSNIELKYLQSLLDDEGSQELDPSDLQTSDSTPQEQHTNEEIKRIQTGFYLVMNLIQKQIINDSFIYLFAVYLPFLIS